MVEILLYLFDIFLVQACAGCIVVADDRCCPLELAEHCHFAKQRAVPQNVDELLVSCLCALDRDRDLTLVQKVQVVASLALLQDKVLWQE